jgi:hypothetical protein
MDSEEIAKLSHIPLPILAGVVAVLFLLVLLHTVCLCRIWKKAGFWGGWGLLMLIPPFTFALPLVLAAIDWPVERRRR